MSVHKCELWRSGPPVMLEQDGEVLTVDGELMVRMKDGAILPIGDGWFRTRAEARRAAAQKIDNMRVELAGIAARLRAEAEAEEHAR